MNNNRIFKISIAALFIGLLLVGAVFLVVHAGNKAQNSSGSKSVAAVDSGVEICKVMAAPAAHPDLDEKWRSERIAAFNASKYEDLRTAGVALTEAAYKMEKELKDSDLSELNELNSHLETTHAELRTACKNHGVELVALGS